ncbi:MAG TPA: hypothetical protein PKM73_04790 [Verrucomicrobiota bacterium]|nr:hypothetical protein [Verrucomicrobiota bacterium]HNU50679.1 hypothetical protein [Verrucomicrobiota bacterium]
MNKAVGVQMIVYSLLLAGLSYFINHLAPSLARSILIVGLAGAVVFLIASIRTLAGNRSKVLPLLTLIPVNLMLLANTVSMWEGGSPGMPEGRTLPMIVSLLFVLSFAMLVRIAYAGVVFQAPPTGSTPPSPTRARP